jgi:PAS domain S-box-containing protein
MSRVLVVDDEQVVCELLGYVLQSDHRQVLFASCVAQAEVIAVDMAPIEVALVDRSVSGKSGLELSRRLKKLDPMTEVILMTTYPSVDSVMEAVEVGASDFLAKPFDDVQQVAIRVQSAEGQSTLRREQQRLHLALQESEERYRKLFEGSPDAVMVIDAETGSIRDVNDAAMALYGYERSAFVTCNVDVLQSQTRRPSLVEYPGYEPQGAAPNATVFQRSDKRLDGKAIEVEVNAAHFQLDGRRMTVHVIRDIGDRVRAAEEKSRLEAQLRHAQKMEALGRLAGGIAHDFNNLLAVIINYAGFVADTLGSLPEREQVRAARDDIDQILQAGASAASVTRQLLAFSRKEVVKPEALSINTVVLEFEKILRRTVGSEVRIETRLAAVLQSVKLDRGQIEQVIMNLVVNARDAMPSGGKITIATENIGKGALEAFATHPLGTVVLTVSDQGTGMDAATVERIFDPFFTTKGRGAGTGLGLATVRGIVEQAAGTIEVLSNPGTGTEFRMAFPACAEEMCAPISSPPAALSPASGTILVVDDDDAFRRGVHRILTRVGYNLLEARGGAEAVELHAKSSTGVDLLLTDLVMPGMSGEELANALRARQPSLKVIYMTGYASKALAAPAGEEGPASILPKPFRENRLLALVREVLDANRTPTAAAREVP